MAQSLASPESDQNSRLILGTLKSAWKALLLQEDVYTSHYESPHPFRHGFGTISIIVLTVALAYAVGVALSLLTLPRIDLIQQGIYDIIARTEWYSSSDFAGLFDFIYGLGWMFIRILGGFPSWAGVIYSFFSVVIFGILNWLGYGILSHMVGRWLGGSVDKGKHFGVLALSYAPTLLLIANIIPGLTVPPTLIALWALATSYQAIRVSFNLSWWRSVLVVVLPYVLATIFFYIAIYGGVALGVAVYRWIV